MCWGVGASTLKLIVSNKYVSSLQSGKFQTSPLYTRDVQYLLYAVGCVATGDGQRAEEGLLCEIFQYTIPFPTSNVILCGRQARKKLFRFAALARVQLSRKRGARRQVFFSSP